MKRVFKIMIIGLLFVFIYFVLISLYIGNYLYDYTLNPYAHKNISERIQTNETIRRESREWLDQKSADIYIHNDGLELHSYYIEQESSIYMIMVHGYRGDGASIIAPIKTMQKQGYNLLIPDLRGHGQSEGDYIGMGWDDRRDILKWIDYLLKRDHQAQIILYGVSMGAATVMNVAGEKLPTQVKAIIEDCGYTSVYDVLKSHFQMSQWEQEWAMHMVSLVTYCRAGYRLEDVAPIQQVQKSQTPILFIHGQKDTFIPVWMLEKLYQAAPCEKEKVIIQAAGHANSCSVDSHLYYTSIEKFIAKYVQKNLPSVR